MNPSGHVKHPPPFSADNRRTATARSVRAHRSRHSTAGERFDEIAPLVSFVAVAAPRVIVLTVPYLLFVLILTGPVGLLLTMLVVRVAARVLVVLTGAVLVAPYLLVRRLRVRGASHAAPPPLVHQFHPSRASAGRRVPARP